MASEGKIRAAGIFRSLRSSYPKLEPTSVNPTLFVPLDEELLQSGFRYALALTHHRHDAEDLAQEAWVNLCRRYGKVTSRAAFFTAIRNLFIDRCRRARVIAFDSLDHPDSLSSSDEKISLGALDDLQRLLGNLRPGEREAIYLHHIEGHTADADDRSCRVRLNTPKSSASRVSRSHYRSPES